MLNKRNINKALRPDHRAGDHKASRRVFCWNSKNECQDTVEEPATAKAKEETTSCLRTRDVGALTTLRSMTCTDWQIKRRYACRLLDTSSLKEGAMWHVCRKPELWSQQTAVARQWLHKHARCYTMS
jgi:hypothetical protein